MNPGMTAHPALSTGFRRALWRTLALVLALSLALAASVSARAQQHERGSERHDRRGAQRAPQWRGDIRHFHERDLRVWHGGRWVHGRHDGRLGWWWVVGSIWYFYPAPVYPYPNPYQPPTVIATAGPPAPAAGYWYYCRSAGSYYPYVAVCPESWTRVPAASARP